MGSYDFETGLADDFDMDISNAYFAYSAKLAREGEPRVALHLEGKAEGGTFDEPVELVEEQALLFTVGDKWMITNDGATVVHESGQDRAFQQNSAIVRLINSGIKAGIPFKKRGEATEASIWTGLRVHFKRVTASYGGDIGDRQVLAIEKYLGEAEKGGHKTSGSKPAATSKPAAAAEEEAPAGDDITLISDTVGGAIFKRLQKLAVGAEDYETWAAEAVELPKVSDSDEVQDIILNDERGAKVWELLKG